MKYYLALGLLIFFSIIIWLPKQQSNNPISPKTTLSPDVAPQPFVELTIPFLQKYQYDSTLGERVKVAGNANYTSYLTSYTSDGLRINGLITIPQEEMPQGGWPAIIFIHGYIPPSQYKTQERYIEYVNSLASNGFVVFKIDLRGHGSSEGEPRGAYYSSDYIKDVLNAQTALKKTDFVNGEKIGLWGHSMAGNIIVRVLAARPEIRVAVIWAGAVYTYQDMVDYGINDNSYRTQDINYNLREEREAIFNHYGKFSSDSEFWKKVSPIEYLKESSSKIQINHAVDDSIVSVNYARNLVEKLENSKTSVELWEYPNGGHNITGSSFSLAMKRTIEFFHQNF